MNRKEMILELRDQTGLGVMLCNQILEQFEQNYEQALTALREIAATKAMKSSGREAQEGKIELYTHNNGRIGVMVEDKPEIELFWKIHSHLPREGPGSDASTLRAFSMLPNLPAQPRILDIGCGPGAQTVVLARVSHADIIAIDTHQPFLDDLAVRAAQAGVSERIHLLKASMFELEFEKPFDLIWSEGAIYIMGFETGLREWRRLLKPSGYIAVTEISWLKPNPPETVRDFWEREYPGMGSVEENLKRMASAGYHEVGHFILPENDWWDNYYHPLVERIHTLREQYRHDELSQQSLDAEQLEIELYRKYSEWYGYVFYLGQRQGIHEE